jgi:long-chain fatty acid transport protein
MNCLNRMIMMRRLILNYMVWNFIVILCISLLFQKASFAGTPVHGAKAAGMGTAFVGLADDPSAIMHNPAGLTQLKGTNTYGGVTAVIPSTEYISPSGASEETDFRFFSPPHVYISSDFNMKNVVLGLGVFSPFGIGGRYWNEDGLTRYISTESTIATISVNPTLAWQVTPKLSIGFGVYYLHSFNTAEKMLDQSMFGAPDGKFSLDADGGGWGYNLGILVAPFEKLHFGFAFRSKVSIDQKGDAELENIAPALQPVFGGSQFKTDVETSVTLPEIVSFGIAYKPATGLTLAFDVEWVRWSRFNQQIIDFKNEVPAAGFSDVLVDLDWNNQWLIKFGLEYYLNEHFALRTGYAFVETPVPEHTLSPANPDEDGHNFSIGFGYKIGKWIVDGFYMVEIYKDRDVNNDILSGEYKNIAHFIGFSIGNKF